jgi:ribonuclease J
VDFTPIDGNLIDLRRISEIGAKGVLLLLAESTNIERAGSSMSESRVGDSLNHIFAENTDRRIFIATFASNIHRLQQILDIAKKYKRKVAFAGRSMINIVEYAGNIGELKLDKNNIIDIEQISKVEDRNLCIITTGSQGEPMSALARISSDEFNKVMIGYNDTVIISASPIPGNERMVYNVINNLYRRGAKVIYESLAEVHASGHACQDEIKLIHSLIKP